MTSENWPQPEMMIIKTALAHALAYVLDLLVPSSDLAEHLAEQPSLLEDLPIAAAFHHAA